MIPKSCTTFWTRSCAESKAHDSKKLHDFLDKIMRNSKGHDPKKLQDFLDKIMRRIEADKARSDPT
jgi:hypothetical protein